MRTTRLCLALLTLSWCAAAIAHSFVYEDEDGTPVFRISYPQGWLLELDFAAPDPGGDAPPAPRVVEAMPKDGSLLWLGTWVPPGVTDFAQAAAYFDSLEQYLLTEVQAQEPAARDLNGMAARIIRGTAKKDGEPVEWVMAFFQPRQGVIAAALYVGVIEARDRYRQDLDSIIDSISPAR